MVQKRETKTEQNRKQPTTLFFLTYPRNPYTGSNYLLSYTFYTQSTNFVNIYSSFQKCKFSALQSKPCSASAILIHTHEKETNLMKQRKISTKNLNTTELVIQIVMKTKDNPSKHLENYCTNQRRGPMYLRIKHYLRIIKVEIQFHHNRTRPSLFLLNQNTLFFS